MSIEADKNKLLALARKAQMLDGRGKFREADLLDGILVSLARNDRSYEKGLREGLDSAVVLLDNSTDLEAVREVTEYLRDVRDNIPKETASEVIEQTHLIETPEELDSLMAFDV